MTELQLDRFITENAYEIEWWNNALIAAFPYSDMEEFNQLVGCDYFVESNFIALYDFVQVDISDVCEVHGIDPENIVARSDCD